MCDEEKYFDGTFRSPDSLYSSEFSNQTVKDNYNQGLNLGSYTWESYSDILPGHRVFNGDPSFKDPN